MMWQGQVILQEYAVATQEEGTTLKLCVNSAGKTSMAFSGLEVNPKGTQHRTTGLTLAVMQM